VLFLLEFSRVQKVGSAKYVALFLNRSAFLFVPVYNFFRLLFHRLIAISIFVKLAKLELVALQDILLDFFNWTVFCSSHFKSI